MCCCASVIKSAKTFAVNPFFSFCNLQQVRSLSFRIPLPKKASTRQLTPLMALKKIWGSCFKHGCSTTSWGMPLELINCSWNLGVVLTIKGLLRSTGLLERNRERSKDMDWAKEPRDTAEAYPDSCSIWFCRYSDRIESVLWCLILWCWHDGNEHMNPVMLKLIDKIASHQTGVGF